MNKEDLTSRYNKNLESINLYTNRCEIINANSLKNKILKTLLHSVMPYTIFLFSAILLHNQILAIIPSFFIPIIFSALPLIIGFTTTKVLEHKNKNVKKIKNFSSAKTKKEKLEEKIDYETKIKKANYENMIIDKILKDFNNNYLKKACLNDLKKESLELSNDLDKKYKDLELIAREEVLSETFIKIRNKHLKVINTFGIISLGYATVLYLSPLLLFMPHSLVLNACFIEFFIGMLTSSYFLLKNDILNKKVFKELNNKLGNFLSNKVSSDEKENFRKSLEKLSKDIYNKEMRLIEIKETLKVKEDKSKEQKLNSIKNYNNLEKYNEDLFSNLDISKKLVRK